VLALPCKASWELEGLWFVCVALLMLGGIRGKKSMGDIGEVSMISKQEGRRNVSFRRTSSRASTQKNTVNFFVVGYGICILV